MHDPDDDFHDADTELEVVGSCDECGVDVFSDEDDGSGLCESCSWYLSQSGDG